MAGCLLEDVVGEGGVAGEHRAVQVGADDPPGAGAVTAVAGSVCRAVPDPPGDPAQWGEVNAGGADSLVILEPGELPDIGDRAGAEDLADRASAPGDGGEVEQSQP